MNLLSWNERRPKGIDWSWLLFVGLLLVTLWLYLPPYKGSFVGDDFAQQWRIRALIGQPAQAYHVFSPTWTDWYYRPLQNLWMLGNRLFFGLLPAGYYYLQICWHLLSVCLLFHFARRLKVGPAGALIAAALFAVSGQNQLTVDWISSIGNVMGLNFVLLALVSFLAYLQRPERRYLLAVVVITTVLALASHGLSIVLPALLLALWFTQPARRRVQPVEISAGLILACVIGAYVILQITRPNANVAGAELIPGSFLQFIRPQAIAGFLFTVSSRWTLLDRVPWVANLASAPAIETLVAVVVTIGLIAAGVIGFRRGNRAVRVGLIWVAASLTFVYTAVWFPQPDQLDNRHVYYALAGLGLTLGAGLQLVSAAAVSRPVQRRGWAHRDRRLTYALGLAVVAFLLLHIRQVRQAQDSVFNLTRRVEQAEADMKHVLPSPNAQTRLFAYRFILSPSYFIPVASVWYDRPDLNGGSLESLLKLPVLTADDYVLDYGKDGLYNLMPELQRHRETVLLWRRPPVSADWLDGGATQTLQPDEYQIGVVAGPAGDRRLAIEVAAQAGQWSSLGFETQVPETGRLELSTLGAQDDSFRVRLLDEAGVEQLLFEDSVQADQDGRWQKQAIPLDALAGQTVTILLETRCAAGCQAGTAYWADPRLTAG